MKTKSRYDSVDALFLIRSPIQFVPWHSNPIQACRCFRSLVILLLTSTNPVNHRLFFSKVSRVLAGSIGASADHPQDQLDLKVPGHGPPVHSPLMDHGRVWLLRHTASTSSRTSAGSSPFSNSSGGSATFTGSASPAGGRFLVDPNVACSFDDIQDANIRAGEGNLSGRLLDCGIHNKFVLK